VVPPTPDPLETARLDILRALQAGEIDVATAGERLAALDDAATAFEGGTPSDGGTR
jgi:hypothetical protein